MNDVISLNNPDFNKNPSIVYPPVIEITGTKDTYISDTYWELFLKCDHSENLAIGLYC